MDYFKTLPQAMIEPMQVLITKLLAFAPNIIAAILMLILGYTIAKLACFLISRLFIRIGVNKLSDRVGLSSTIATAGFNSTLSQMIGAVFFWIVMLTFIVSASEVLGLDRVSGTIDNLVLYLPKVIAALVILLIGLFVASFVRNAIKTGMSAMSAVSSDNAKVLGNVAYGFLVVISALLAISQLDIDVTLLNRVLQILLLTVAVAVMLSMGLGTKEISANVMAGIYLRDVYKFGASIEVDGIEGIVSYVGTTKTEIENDGGSVSIPNQHLLNAVVRVKK